MDKYLISAESYEEYKKIIRERNLDPKQCIFIPQYKCGNEYSGKIREQKLQGRTVSDKKYLIGWFNEKEERWLLGDTRKRYYCKCPVCGKEFWACKSILQEDFEMADKGHGTCPKCKTFHNLTVDEENERMIVTPWKEYLKRKEGVLN